MNQRAPLAAVLALLVALGVVAAVPVAAHGNHVDADPQVSADGSVVIESLFALQGGYLVLHTDDGGQPGEVIGHAPVSMGGASNVEVRIDDGAWASLGEVTQLWAVVHRDDGDGEFRPGDDPPIRFAGSIAGTRFTVGKGASQAAVSMGDRTLQRTHSPTVSISRVSVPADSYLVIRKAGGADAGRVVGHATLSAGDHRNVTVGIDPDYFRDANAEFDLEAVVYRDDGDGEFDPSADEPVAVDGDPVGTLFTLRKVDESAANGSEGVNGSGSGDSGGLVETATEGQGTSVETVDDGTGSGSGSPMPTPGLGPTTAFAAVALALAVLLWRRSSSSDRRSR